MIRLLVLALVTALAVMACAAAFSLEGRALHGQGASLDSGGEPVRLPLVTVVADGKVYQLQSSCATVSDLLGHLGIALAPLDRTSTPLGKPLTDGMLVRVTRVRCRQEVAEVVIPSSTVVLADPKRVAGFTKTLHQGRDGLVRRVVTIWEKDGEETQRTTSREETLVEAEDTVILRGTYGLPSRHGNWRTPLRMTATAYDPGPRSCGRYADGTTATGAKAQKGVVATDPRVIPMGTRLYIPGYGFAVAADRGSAIRGMRIDLCYDTYREAKQFGRRQVDVYIVD